MIRPTPHSQHMALEGRMVQQRKALAIGSSDIDARHLGEDFNNAAGTSTCRDGRMQGRVRVGILKQTGLVTHGCLCPRSSCFLDLGLVSGRGSRDSHSPAS